MAQVRLKPKLDRAARRFHPWIFSGAVARVDGSPQPGDVVRVVDADGQFLAWGHFSPASQIRVRLLDWNEEATVDDGWWRARIRRAAERRGRTGAPEPTARRLIFSESDFIPGLIVDDYAGFSVLQALTAGVDRQKRLIADVLSEREGSRGVYERSDAEVRGLEGLDPAVGLLWGEAPSGPVEFMESGLRFLADIAGGQKTGFFLDQRDNRRIVAQYATGREVLDCFSYTGGFAVFAASAGASSITRLDSSAPALDLGGRNLAVNGLSGVKDEAVVGDVFKVLRQFRDRGRSFDLIVLDPPKFAPTKAHVPAASRAYKDINLLALKLLRPGGILATFSCSQGIDTDLFQKIVFGASLDAGREVQILRRLHQADDHPVRLSFPESDYLKGLLCLAV